jgi:pyridoxine 5'-phosphate synthase PdxJ
LAVARVCLVPENQPQIVTTDETIQATNHLVDVFTNLAQANNSVLNYVIPISDNGGSSSELIRVFGGPGM